MKTSDAGTAAGWLKTPATPGLPTEAETKELISRFGIRVPRGVTVTDPSDPALASVGYPAAVKACVPGLLHKTEAGAVVLGVGEREAARTVTDMLTRFPGAVILVEEMVSFQGPEFIVGGIVDPVLGPAVMAGSGGIMAEIREDTAWRLLPCPADEAVRMLEGLSISPVFRGFRSMTLDIYGLARVVEAAGRVILALGPLFGELDLNPVVFSRNGWIALDAKLVLDVPRR